MQPAKQCHDSLTTLESLYALPASSLLLLIFQYLSSSLGHYAYIKREDNITADNVTAEKYIRGEPDGCHGWAAQRMRWRRGSGAVRRALALMPINIKLRMNCARFEWSGPKIAPDGIRMVLHHLQVRATHERP